MPEAFWTERTKPAIALPELRRVMQAGVSFGAVLADAVARKVTGDEVLSRRFAPLLGLVERLMTQEPHCVA